MIRVRYMNHLSPGLHGKAEAGAHGVTVYLVPGLTGRQRRAALRRLRQEGSRGCGPALPGAGLRLALAADRFRVGLRYTGAVIRQHPAGSLLPTALAGLLMTLFVFASVSAGISQLQQTPMPQGPMTPVNVQPALTGRSAPARESPIAGHPHPAASGGGASGGGASWSLDASATATGGHPGHP